MLDKPAGLVVHPAPGNEDGTLVNALLAHCGDTLPGIGGERRPGIVHRLDKDSTGVMVVAKTELASAALTAAFAARDLDRAYLALAWGLPSPLEGEIEGAIGRDPRDRKRMAVVTRGGRAALTRYRTARAWQTAASLLECRLATGRTHQIACISQVEATRLWGTRSICAASLPRRELCLMPRCGACWTSRARPCTLRGSGSPTQGPAVRWTSRPSRRATWRA